MGLRVYVRIPPPVFIGQIKYFGQGIKPERLLFYPYPPLLQFGNDTD